MYNKCYRRGHGDRNGNVKVIKSIGAHVYMPERLYCEKWLVLAAPP